MGMSASGELFFGVFYGEEDPRWPKSDDPSYPYREPPEDWPDDGYEWDEWLALQAGAHDDPYADPVVETMPERTYEHHLSYQEREAKYKAAREAWDKEHADWVARRDAYWALKKRLVKECPVELIEVGHYDNSGKALILRGTRSYEYWGDAKKLDLEELAKLATPERVCAAKTWCEDHGLDWEDPSWLLTGSYG